MKTNGDGTYTLEWDALPRADASFKIYKKVGSASDPDARRTEFDWNTDILTTGSNSYVTDNVLLSYNVCFAVRLQYPGYTDSNQKSVCTNHKRIDFRGLSSAQTVPGGVRLDWQLIPIQDVEYLVFSTSKSGEYDFMTPVEVVESNSVLADAPPLGSTWCYAVRYNKDGLPADVNKNEICIGEGALEEFTGVESAESRATGNVTVSWKSAGASANSYNIYDGVNFSKLVKTVSGSVTEVSISDLVPNEMYDLGVRAVDASGREDTNTKTISVRIADLRAPTFTGVNTIEKTGARSFRIRWAPANPVPSRYDIFVTALGPSNAKANLNCDSASNAEACRDLINWSNPRTSVQGASTEHEFTNIGDDQSFFVGVRAISNSGISDTNYVVKRLTLEDAGAPIFAGIESVTSVPGGKAKITWSAPAGQVSYFRVSTTVSGVTTTTVIPALLPEGCSTDCDDVLLEYTTGILSAETTYSFTVRSEDRNAAVDGNTASLILTTGDTNAPTAVSGLGGSALGELSVQLTFTSPPDSDVSGYRVYQQKCLSGLLYLSASCPDENWGVKAESRATRPPSYTPNSNVALLVTGLEGRSVYRFSVVAVDSSGNDGPAAVRVLATRDSTPPLFGGVQAASQSPNNPNYVRLTWTSPGGDVLKYIVYRKKGAAINGAGLIASSLPAGVDVFEVNAPAQWFDLIMPSGSAGETWYFVVHAVDDATNEDGNTTQVSFTVPDLTPPNLNASTVTVQWDGGQDGIMVRWQLAPEAAQYRISAQCINVREASGSLGSFPSAAPAPGEAGSQWVEVGVEGADSTSFKLARVSSLSACPGGEHRAFRFIVNARKATSDWDDNAEIKPSLAGVAIPDLSDPIWPVGATLTGVQTDDTPGSEAVRLTWTKAVDAYTDPVRSGSGISGYDIYLLRSSSPERVLIKSAVVGAPVDASTLTTTISATDMQTACNAQGVNNTTCLFGPSGAYNFALNARDASNNVQVAGQELPMTSPLALSDITPPKVTGVSVSSSTVSDGQAFTLNFSPSEDGTYRVLECLGGDCASLTEILGATDMDSGVSVEASIFPEDLSSGSGTKYLALEMRDEAGNTSLFDKDSLPVIPAVYRNAQPENNVSHFRITRFNDANTAMLRLSWQLPSGLGASDSIRIVKNSDIPESCADGTTVGSVSGSTTFFDTPLGTDTVNNVGFSAFVVGAGGSCFTPDTPAQDLLNAATRFGATLLLDTTFRVDSSGPTAKYLITGNRDNLTATIAEARERSRVEEWFEPDTSSPTCTPHPECTDIGDPSYFQTSSLSLATANVQKTKSYDYSTDAIHPLWSKRFHRIHVVNSTGDNAQLSDVLTYGKVPPGMVFVAAEDWPVASSARAVEGSSPPLFESFPTGGSFGNWDAIPHDFAIDKFEARLVTGTLGTNGASFPNGDTGVLISDNSTVTLPHSSAHWGNYRQGCLNRSFYSADGSSAYASVADLPQVIKNTPSTVIPNPRRKFMLADGVRWSVAAYGTPELGSRLEGATTVNYCNVNRGLGVMAPGTTNSSQSTEKCLSRFGARNMVGNLQEYVDEYAASGKRGSLMRFPGTLAEHSVASMQLIGSPSATWSWRAANWLSSPTAFAIRSHTQEAPTQAIQSVEGGSTGVGWVPVRGGTKDSSEGLGRFAVDMGAGPAATDTGGRCAISAPFVKPRIAKFGSDADQSEARLFWITLDTENTTAINLASASSKAEIDAWDGVNASAGVTVMSASLDAVTGKHIVTPAGGDCSAGYTPGASGFESELGSPPENLWSGKFCESTPGTRYYKLCATSPSIPQVTDSFTDLERTSCSVVVSVDASLPPSLLAAPNGATLSNDSDGAFARFYWNVSGGSNVTARLIYGPSPEEVARWNGDDQTFNGFDVGSVQSGVYYGTFSGVRVLTVPAGVTRPSGGTVDCDVAEYVPGQGFLAYEPNTDVSDGIAASHFACVRLASFPKWSKLYFKVAVANTDGAGSISSGWVQSEVRGVGHVPTGMVMVTREEWQSIDNGTEDYTSWPVCVGDTAANGALNDISWVMPGATGYQHGLLGCVFDYAIDKYESYATGSKDSGVFSALLDMTGNTSAGIMRSARTEPAATSWNWFAFKRACDNRTAELISAGFIGASPTPMNRVRLPSGNEWVTASFGSLDDGDTNDTCWSSTGNEALLGQGLSPSPDSFWGCVSHFGTYNQIGNAEEWTDEVTTGSSRSNSVDWLRMLGTLQATSFPGSGVGSVNSEILTGSTTGRVISFDFLTGFVSGVGGATAAADSLYTFPDNLNIGTAGGSGGANWAALRGGTSGASEIANGQGRTSLRLISSPARELSGIGGRCSLLPQ